MTIYAKLTRSENNLPHVLKLEITADSLPHFCKLVQKALNTWPDAHPELKELGDKLGWAGAPLQDYYAQRTDTTPTTPTTPTI